MTCDNCRQMHYFMIGVLAGTKATDNAVVMAACITATGVVVANVLGQVISALNNTSAKRARCLDEHLKEVEFWDAFQNAMKFNGEEDAKASERAKKGALRAANAVDKLFSEVRF